MTEHIHQPGYSKIGKLIVVADKQAGGWKLICCECGELYRLDKKEIVQKEDINKI